MPAPWLRLLFYPWDRLDRTRFWYAMVAAVLIVAVPDAAIVLVIVLIKAKKIESVDAAVTPVMMGFIAIAAYVATAACAKRFNDRGKSSWWVLAGFVPIVGVVWCLVELGFLPGKTARNCYGSAPGGEASDLGAIFDAAPVTIVEQKGRASNLVAIIVAWLLGFGLFAVNALLVQ